MAPLITPTELLYILVIGILPALLWLWFWLREDFKRPEPRGLILLSFFVGALGIMFVLPLQQYARTIISGGTILIIVWAFIEELVKYFGAYFTDFKRRAYDEPVDTMIYLVTVALGFAAFENVLFLIKSTAEGGFHVTILTGIMRFLGATLLHVFASAVLGGIIALAFCKSKTQKRLYTVFGILVATALHTAFNFFIINGGPHTSNILSVFGGLWIGVIFLILFFEKIKSVVCSIPFGDTTLRN